MLVSHKHQFIFLKPQKTAGTSIELVLSKYCGEDDVITPFLFEPDPDIRKNHGAPEPANYVTRKKLNTWTKGDLYRMVRYGMIPEIRFKEHHPAEVVLNLLGTTTWNEYRKISVIRNPWDHAVSYYNWVKYRKHFNGSFDEYVRTIYKTYWHFLSVQNEYCMDYVIRFEHLHEDLASCLEFLGLPQNDEVPQAKTSIRKDKSYHSHYTEETMEIVRKKNLYLIDQFGYTFDGGI